MGSSNSKELPSNEYLLRLSGKEHISPMDPFWNVLLSFSFKPPSSRYVSYCFRLLTSMGKILNNFYFLTDLKVSFWTINYHRFLINYWLIIYHLGILYHSFGFFYREQLISSHQTLLISK